LVVGYRLATPLLAALFSYLALERLSWRGRFGKWGAVLLLVISFSGIAYGLGYFLNQTVRALPEIADKSIPSVINWAQQQGVELPFTDYESLKDAAFETVKGEVRFLGSFAKAARGALAHVAFLVAGCMVAVSLFLTPRFDTARQPAAPDSIYALCCGEIKNRFATLYRSFSTVMGAQIVISAINTALTGIFTFVVDLPYGVVVVGVTFLCGLVPVVGNLVSNTIIVGIGFTISPKMALAALVFLVAIHKLEYFLNSQIVGWRIHSPLWLTLLGLIVGERLLGVEGMVLAPVVLCYLRLEGAVLKVPSDAAQPRNLQPR
jgi:predicted PurR-regulated permease PerM